MGSLNLTGDERNLIERFAREREGVTSRLSFYASVLVPMALFATYGLIRRDFLAELIAFAGVFAFMTWRIAAELSRTDVFQSAMRKIAEHERRERL